MGKRFTSVYRMVYDRGEAEAKVSLNGGEGELFVAPSKILYSLSQSMWKIHFYLSGKYTGHLMRIRKKKIPSPFFI